MAKSAAVVSLFPVSAGTSAVTTGELDCPEVQRINFAEALRRFGKQLDNPELNQRLHEEQVDAGLWEHLKTPCSTQATLEVVCIRRKGARGRPSIEQKLVDGYHRLFYWRKIGMCPFKFLNIIVHIITVSATADDEEIAERIDELARTINSKQSVKRNTDFLTAALREAAGGDASAKAKSKAYRLGSRAASYLKRTVGDPAKLSGPKLKAAARANLETHKFMDQLFHFAENNPQVKPHMAQVFHTGIATAIFDTWKGLPTPAAREVALDLVKHALETATSAPAARAFAVTSKSAYRELVEVLRQLADPAVDAELKVKGGNREGFYTQVAKRMASALDAINKAAKKRAK
jgi:hypothetical protein